MIDRDLWNGRSVFLTGHTGFKGSWLTAWLLEMGAVVHGLSLQEEKPRSQFNLDDFQHPNLHHTWCDIADFKPLSEAMAQAKPSVVIHMAAQSIVRDGYDAPVETFATNAMGTAHLLEAARHIGSIEACLIITTDKCYRNNEWDWPYRENDALGGHDPYSSSKACAELITAAYRDSFFKPTSGPMIASARAGNVIGGGDWSNDRIVPDIARAISAGTGLHIRSPHAIRPWQHVLDCLYGYLMLCQSLLAPADGDAKSAHDEAWNFGPSVDSTKTVIELVRAYREHDTAEVDISVVEAEGKHEAKLLALDSSKARHHLNWTPVLTFPEAVRFTAEWYRDVRGGADPFEMTKRQISDYCAKMAASAG